MKEKLLSIVIPAYNEQSRIAEAIKRVKNLDFSRQGYSKEIIVVNDGSTDRTENILRAQKGIIFVSYKKNRGKGFALREGFRRAKGEIICIQDADLEYEDAAIARMLSEVLSGAEVVYGSRFKGNVSGMHFSHLCGNKLLTLATKTLFFSSVSDMETALKMFRAPVLKSLTLKSNSFDFEPEITAKVLLGGHKIKEVPVKYYGREKREKKISWKDGVKALGVLVKCRAGLL